MAFDPISLIVFLIVGLVAGWLADIVVKDISFGLIGDLLVGVVGAFIGGLIFGALNLGYSGIIWQIISAFVGAVLLLFIIRLVKRA